MGQMEKTIKEGKLLDGAGRWRQVPALKVDLWFSSGVQGMLFWHFG